MVLLVLLVDLAAYTAAARDGVFRLRYTAAKTFDALDDSYEKRLKKRNL